MYACDKNLLVENYVSNIQTSYFIDNSMKLQKVISFIKKNHPDFSWILTNAHVRYYHPNEEKNQDI